MDSPVIEPVSDRLRRREGEDFFLARKRSVAIAPSPKYFFGQVPSSSQCLTDSVWVLVPRAGDSRSRCVSTVHSPSFLKRFWSGSDGLPSVGSSVSSNRFRFADGDVINRLYRSIDSVSYGNEAVQKRYTSWPGGFLARRERKDSVRPAQSRLRGALRQRDVCAFGLRTPLLREVSGRRLAGGHLRKTHLWLFEWRFAAHLSWESAFSDARPYWLSL